MYAENLKKIRKNLNLSVDKFAQMLDIPSSTIWGYEGKKRVPSIELSIQLYKTFNVNLNWFVSGEGEMFNGASSLPVAKETLRKEVIEILKEEGVLK